MNFSFVTYIKFVAKTMVRNGQKMAIRTGRWGWLPIAMILASLLLSLFGREELKFARKLGRKVPL